MIRQKPNHLIHTLDLNFMGLGGAIAAYLIPHRRGALLVECGPGSTLPALEENLRLYGFGLSDVTDVLLTHIHLDHAGAAGHLARAGARIHVHPVGAPHLINPDKLLASAGRIYGDLMEVLWGEFLPVPTEHIHMPQDGEVIQVEGLSFRALDTPGHASHHYVYIFDEVCFSGDIGGVRMVGVNHLRLPMPPPEFDLESWRSSLARLRAETFSFIAPTHFGIFSDPQWHLAAIAEALDEIEAWMQATMPLDLPLEALSERFLDWNRRRSEAAGVNSKVLDVYEAANPSWMSSQGIRRYWQKRHPNK